MCSSPAKRGGKTPRITSGHFKRDGIEQLERIGWQGEPGRDLRRASPRVLYERMLARSGGAAAGTAAREGFEHRQGFGRSVASAHGRQGRAIFISAAKAGHWPNCIQRG